MLSPGSVPVPEQAAQGWFVPPGEAGAVHPHCAASQESPEMGGGKTHSACWVESESCVQKTLPAP